MMLNFVSEDGFIDDVVVKFHDENDHEIVANNVINGKISIQCVDVDIDC